MNLIVDTREPGLYDKLVADNITFAIQSAPLLLGDIALEVADTKETLVLFERKSLSDLLSSIKDGRYVEQSHRLIHTSGMPTHNIVYIIEGMLSQLRTPLDRRMCLSAMTTLSYYKGFSVIRTCSLNETAEWILSMSAKIQKERAKGNVPAFLSSFPEKDPSESKFSEEGDRGLVGISTTLAPPAPYCEVVHKVKKDNITPENIGEIILCTIPGISSTTAVEIMKQYTSFPHFMKEIESRPESLSEIHLTSNGKSRKLGKNVIDNILRFLRPTSASK